MKSKRFFLKLINFYQKFLSPDTGFVSRIGITRRPSCVFFPTCSEYTKEAIQKHGVYKGIVLGFLRIIRCHPWQKNHIDPVRDHKDSQ